MLRLFVDASLNAVKLRIFGSSVIKTTLREPRFPDTHAVLYIRSPDASYEIIGGHVVASTHAIKGNMDESPRDPV